MDDAISSFYIDIRMEMKIDKNDDIEMKVKERMRSVIRGDSHMPSYRMSFLQLLVRLLNKKESIMRMFQSLVWNPNLEEENAVIKKRKEKEVSERESSTKWTENMTQTVTPCLCFQREREGHWNKKYPKAVIASPRKREWGKPFLDEKGRIELHSICLTRKGRKVSVRHAIHKKKILRKEMREGWGDDDDSRKRKRNEKGSWK